MSKRESLPSVAAYYADLLRWQPIMENPAKYFSTPPVNEILAFLEATRIVLDEGRLHAIHVRHDPIDIFNAVGPDRFESEFGQIQFERDGTGSVTRMLASSGRVRNLRFERVDW